MKIALILPVYHLAPWHREMTIFTAKMCRSTTNLPFDVVIAERSSDYMVKDQFINHLERPATGSSYVKDFNAGIEYAKDMGAEFVIHSGNDLFLTEGWLEALIEPFNMYEDCGISTISVIESHSGMHNGVIGHDKRLNIVTEGYYGPLMMFRSSDRLDEVYEGKGSDDDLVMRVYTRGQRAYRNLAAIAYHLNGVTQDAKPDEEKTVNDAGGETFHRRWSASPLDIYQKIRRGAAIWGKEHER